MRERKRHTARRVESTPSVVPTGYHPPILTWPGGYPTWVPLWQGTPQQGTPHPDLVEDTLPGSPWQGTPQGTPMAGYPPGRVPPSRVPPGWTWQGTPLGIFPMEFWEMLQSIMGYGYPPGVCLMAFWVMLQSIMGYGYPPSWTDKWMDRHVSKHYLPVVLRTRAVINFEIYMQFIFYMISNKIDGICPVVSFDFCLCADSSCFWEVNESLCWMVCNVRLLLDIFFQGVFCWLLPVTTWRYSNFTFYSAGDSRNILWSNRLEFGWNDRLHRVGEEIQDIKRESNEGEIHTNFTFVTDTVLNLDISSVWDPQDPICWSFENKKRCFVACSSTYFVTFTFILLKLRTHKIPFTDIAPSLIIEVQSSFCTIRHFLQNHGGILPVLTFNGSQRWNVNTTRILLGFCTKLPIVEKLSNK